LSSTHVTLFTLFFLISGAVKILGTSKSDLVKKVFSNLFL
jgi:hypothetical protein